ncbi:hypothetical protein [Rhizobium terrae]|uniref:hypothetical protein n=1 Tax=Rhizobium terrae TaxID=2171756 RepID=UPI0013C2CAE7|nr:hypothetical protein [Rhizobium terrae]
MDYYFQYNNFQKVEERGLILASRILKAAACPRILSPGSDWRQPAKDGFYRLPLPAETEFLALRRLSVEKTTLKSAMNNKA